MKNREIVRNQSLEIGNQYSHFPFKNALAEKINQKDNP